MLQHKKPGDTLYIVSAYREVPPITVTVLSIGHKSITTVHGTKYRKDTGAPVMSRKNFRDRMSDCRAWPSKAYYDNKLEITKRNILLAKLNTTTA